MIFNVKVTVTSLLYATLCYVLINRHTKYEGTAPEDKKVLHWARLY
jgi:hypothetical protein